MEQNQTTALATITPAEAKAKALAIIKAHPEAVSFVRPEDLDTAALFVPVVTCIMPERADFYDPIPGIGIMAKPPLVNNICEKAGINILRTETGKRGEWIWTAHCFGEKRGPDGTMRPGDASYEFDAEKRAELDAINQPGKYNTDIAKRKHLLETAKFGEQRAVTGAQFALIHKMAHVSRSFKTAEELQRGMIVLRVDRNVDGLLRDPTMRDAAIRLALGASETVYGPGNGGTKARDVTPPQAAIEGPAITDDEEPDFGDAPEPVVEDETPEQKAIAEARSALRDWLETPAVKWYAPQGKKSASQAITEVLAKKDASLEELQKMIKLCSQTQASYERSRAKGGAA